MNLRTSKFLFSIRKVQEFPVAIELSLRHGIDWKEVHNFLRRLLKQFEFKFEGPRIKFDRERPFW